MEGKNNCGSMHKVEGNKSFLLALRISCSYRHNELMVYVPRWPVPIAQKVTKNLK